jgi:HK97 gp10 family phage protein
MASKDMGVRDLKRALERLDSKLRNKTLSKAQRAGAKILAREIKANVSVVSGDTKYSVKVRAGKRRQGKTSVDVVIGQGEVYYVGFNEFGTRNQVANPVIRRAVEAKRAEVLAVIGETIEVEIVNGNWSRSIST